MSSRILGVSLVLSCLFLFSANAQPKPMKWGSVPIEDLQMTSYDADTNAVAVILGEYGEIKVDQAGQLQFNYHVRVKLLSEAAYEDWGTYALTFNRGQLNERIRNVEGLTHVLTPGGRAEKHKLGKKSIFKEKLDGDYEQIKFTLPALAPGAIVEYRYKLLSDSPVLLPDWTFQHNEPTRWSELRADISRYYNHVRLSTVGQYTIEEEQENIVDQSMMYRWAVNDVPALRQEPFVTTIEDYRLKLEFQLASYFHPNIGTTKYLRSWEELADELRQINEFGRAFNPPKSVAQLSQQITAGLTTPKEKVEAVHAYVRTKYPWNGDYGFIPDRNLNNIVKGGSASAPEQAILMVGLLREAGVEANPVLVSTRQHGKVKTIYPIFSQFNYLAASVKMGGNYQLLDATNKFSPYTVVDERVLNGAGWMVTKKGHEWIPIKSTAKYMQMIDLSGKLTPDGRAEFDLKSSNAGYRAAYLRTRLPEFSQNEFVLETILEKTGEYELSNVQLANVDSLFKPFDVSAGVGMQNFGVVAGDMMYFSPHALSVFEENPLKLPNRTFPVDFSYPRDYVYTLRLELPEGYTVQEQPANMNLKLPEKGGAFRRSCTLQGNMLIVQSRLTFSKSSYSPKMYRNLRELFDRVVAAQADQIVLKKGAPTGE